ARCRWWRGSGMRARVGRESGGSVRYALPTRRGAASNAPMPDMITLSADTHQALGLGQFAVEFMTGPAGVRGEPAPWVIERTNLFHSDAVLCGISALALATNAPTVLRNEALTYRVLPAGYGSLAPFAGA